MRWFKVRVNGLSHSTRLWSQELGRWTVADQHSALSAELLHAVYRNQLIQSGVKKHKLPEPLHLTRPWDKPKQRGSWMRELAAKAAGV